MDGKDGHVCKNFCVTVVAGSNLPLGARFGPLYDTDVKPLDQMEECDSCDSVVKIFSSGNTLVSHDRTTDWLHRLRASRDVYEQSLELYRSRENLVYIRTRRDVAEGEQLSVWYEYAFGREKNVPYLTLSNIRGIQQYQCNNCSKVFPYPNVLKLHIMNGCDQTRPLPQDTNVYKCNKNDQFSSSKTIKLEPLNITPKSEKIQRGSSSTHFGSAKKCPTENSRPLASINCHVSYNSDISMFTPYTLEARVAILPQTQPEVHLYNKNCNRFCHMNNGYIPEKSTNMHASSDVDEEPIDILHKSFIEFSTKSGHRCVYCGKFYSRKYGLKIHLRTHTGYKPLKCKICLRAFGDPSNLNKHTRLHSEGNTPYKCGYCGKILVRRRDLLRHLNSRHPGHSSQVVNKADIDS